MTGAQSSPSGATPTTAQDLLDGEATGLEVTRKSFGSDNHAGTHPAVLQAIVEANAGDAVAYGADPWTARAVADLRRLSGARGDVHLVLNGSGANVLGLGMLLGRHEAVICAESAHINTDECGSAERILGTKLLTVPAPEGKLTPDLIATRLAGRGDEHFAQPAVVAVTQSTEFGTCYSLAELRAIKEFCAANSLRVFLDGARLANAAAYLGCTLDELASNADVLSFGGTKNGAMGVEAVIAMSPAYSAATSYLRKQHMQLASKMRFLGAQFNALTADDLWLANADHSNAMAARLAAGLARVPGVELAYPVQSDAVFARLTPGHIAALQRNWTFHVWDEQAGVVRWMTAFDTKESDIDAFLADIAATADVVRA
jgi:threonine aldolase